MQVRAWRLAAIGALALGVALPASAIVKAGQKAPAWSGKTTKGKSLSSAQLKGKVVVLNFFNNY